MAPAKGNQFWKRRSKHGRDRIVKSPEVLAEAADEYFQWCVDNPIIEVDFRGKDLQRVELPHPRPFKKEEFARFCGLSEWRLVEDLRKLGNDYSQIITYVEKTIADQKLTYATVGMFNATIVARDLGMRDAKDLSIESKLSKSERDEMIEKLLAKLNKDE